MVAVVRLGGAADVTVEDGLVLARDLHGSVVLFTQVGFGRVFFRPSELLHDLHHLGQRPVGDDVLSVVEGFSALGTRGALAVAAQAVAAEIVAARGYGHRVLEKLQADETSDFVAEILEGTLGLSSHDRLPGLKVVKLSLRFLRESPLAKHKRGK